MVKIYSLNQLLGKKVKITLTESDSIVEGLDDLHVGDFKMNMQSRDTLADYKLIDKVKGTPIEAEITHANFVEAYGGGRSCESPYYTVDDYLLDGLAAAKRDTYMKMTPAQKIQMQGDPTKLDLEITFRLGLLEWVTVIYRCAFEHTQDRLQKLGFSLGAYQSGEEAYSAYLESPDLCVVVVLFEPSPEILSKFTEYLGEERLINLFLAKEIDVDGVLLFAFHSLDTELCHFEWMFEIGLTLPRLTLPKQE